MNNFISAVPAEFADIWWVYDLILVAIIVVSAFILILFRKRNAIKEANALVMRAHKLLCASRANPAKRRLNLFTARNLINSAIYSYRRCVSEQDMFSLLARINALEDISAKLQAETEKSSPEGAEELLKEICLETSKLVNDRIQ